MPSAPIPQNPRLTLLHFTGALSTLSLLAGCSGEPLPPPGAHAPPAAPERANGNASAASNEPARWVYHPYQPEVTLAYRPLERAGCVFTAWNGERWVTTPAKDKGHAGSSLQGDSAASAPGEAADGETCSGHAEAASERPPEDLIAIIRHDERTWHFVGASGALYEAPGPLAPFQRTLAASTPLIKASGEGDVVLAISREGKLLRFTDPSGWKEVTSAPKGARLFDVAVDDKGRALALAFPEALFTSADGGATWSPAPVPAVGLQRVRRTRGGGLLAEGLLASFAWSDKTSITAAPARVTRKLPSLEPAKNLDVSPVPSASAVSKGHAVIDADRYAEVRRAKKGEPWSIARGRLDGHLDVTPLPKSEGCAEVYLGGHGQYLLAVCASLPASGKGSEVRRSADFGETWGEPLTLGQARIDAVGIAVSPDGSALISGVCNAKGNTGSPCLPTAPLRVEVHGAKLRATATVAPALEGVAQSPTYAFDGRSAYFLGRRSGDDQLALFVSHDGGTTFSERPLEGALPQAQGAPAASSHITAGVAASLTAAADGTVGMQVAVNTKNTYLTADADGRGLREATRPSPDTMLGGFGQRLIAYQFTWQSGTPYYVSALWESTDGGATWAAKELPAALTKTRIPNHSEWGLVCSAGGCLINDMLTRVGWGGASAPSPPSAPVDTRPSPSPARLTPIVCDLAPSTRWTAIEHATALPASADRAMRGRSVWSTLTADPVTGAVSAVSAMLPASGNGEARITTRPLLGARPSGSQMALDLASPEEGNVAVRAALHTDPDGQVAPGTRLRDVEVAWENYMEGTSGHGVIPDAGEAADELRGYNEFTGDPNLPMSLSSLKVHGVAIVPYRSNDSSPIAYATDAKGLREQLPFPTVPPESPGGALHGNADLVRVGDKIIQVAFVTVEGGSRIDIAQGWLPDPKVLLLGSPGKPAASAKGAGNDAWAQSAVTLTPAGHTASPYKSWVTWTYAGKANLGVASIAIEEGKGTSFAYFQSLRTDGTLAPPVPVAMLSDLGDRPRPCTEADRATSPRFVSFMHWRGDNRPLYPDLQHPVLVRELSAKGSAPQSAPLSLLTGDAVTHGTPSSACVAAWEASSPKESIERRSVGAIISGDLTHSWLFRVVPAKEPGASAGGGPSTPPPSDTLEYRPMSCHFDPSARVPE